MTAAAVLKLHGAGFSEQQLEALAEYFDEQLATKADLAVGIDNVRTRATTRALPGGRGHRPQPHQGQEPADQRHLRAPSTARYWTSSTGWHSARRSIGRSTSCRPTSTPGSPTTTAAGLTRAGGATARRRYRPSLTPPHSPGRRSCSTDHDRHAHRLAQPTPSVRSSTD